MPAVGSGDGVGSSKDESEEDGEGEGDIDYVRRLLGHKSVLNTQIYVNIEQAMLKANLTNS